ncbi:MAG: SPOR domain-containing protein [Rhodobacteraceae bacterium]|nr:SPOR domain-containing protein [Paracoccaceae bacterium]
MAEIDLEGYGASPLGSGGQVQTLVQTAGAVCSLALIVGVGLWGYRLAVRDVSGVPVIRAVEGPVRVAPSNPGGDVADHQGMAVNTIAAVGGAAALPPEIVLAPEPLDLTAEDAPGLGLEGAGGIAALALPDPAVVPVPAIEAALAAVVADADPAITPASDVSRPILPSDIPAANDAVARALAEALSQDVLPLEPMAEALAEPVMNLPNGGLATSPRPLARPAALRADLAPAITGVVNVSASLPLNNEIDASTLPIGTRLVQLGAFDSPELARDEWARLSASFGDLLSGKSVVIQSAQSGGRTFYRLRAHGFDGEDDARRFCTALLAEDAACIPVAHR